MAMLARPGAAAGPRPAGRLRAAVPGPRRVPQDRAMAAVLIQRLFTAYLPPIWGWATLAWMRRREYV
jgi:hypothetical protein